MNKLIIVITFCSFMTCWTIANYDTIKPPFKYAGYETDDNTHYNGEILYPDYVHTDTLMVVNAKLMNEWIGECSTDEDISDMLSETTLPIEDGPDYLEMKRKLRN